MSLKILGKFYELSNLLEIEKKIVEVVLLGSTTYQRKKKRKIPCTWVLSKLQGSTILEAQATPQSEYISKSEFKLHNITQRSLLVQCALEIQQ